MLKSKYLLIANRPASGSGSTNSSAKIVTSMPVIGICAMFLVFRILYTLDAYYTSNSIKTSTNYFVLTPQCRMPYVDPFSSDVLKIFNPEKFSYSNCSKDEAIVTLLYEAETRQYILHLNMSAIGVITKTKGVNIKEFHCCYREIRRAGMYEKYNRGYVLHACIEFHQNFRVPQEFNFLITECYIGNNTKATIQKDAFTFIQYCNLSTFAGNSKTSTTFSGSHTRKPSVLLLGIDSLSRINLRRTMPNTFRYLQSNLWFELQGYNKVADNTFPNLMALLTSYNSSNVVTKCQPNKSGGLNQRVCNIIWNNFKEYGYRTAYAEDVHAMSTFNYQMKGFVEPPTDYYLRPFTVCIENHLRVEKKGGLPYCVGRKHYAEYIFDFALQFAQTYAHAPVFGLFWANSFSHNCFDTPATMDVKMLEYLEVMEKGGVFERSIVLFFSDHGMRWGPLLKLKSGFFEERLPMMFVSLPSWYQNEHPDFVKALQINQKRLTSPYDIYATLRHILEATDLGKEFPYVNGTTKGISVFSEIPANRICKEAGIADHWCACLPFESVSRDDEVVKKVAKLLVAEMNKYLVRKEIDKKCAVLTLHEIIDASMNKYVDRENYDEHTYRLWYLVNPAFMRFQATFIFHSISNTIKIDVEDISRLDSYENTANCTIEKIARKYCMCRRGKK